MSKRSLTITRHDSLTSNSSDGYNDSEEPVLRQPSTEQTCLTEEEIKAILLQKEETVMHMLEVKSNTARLLLSRTRPRKWDVEKVLDAWFDEGVCSKLLGNQLQVRDHAVSCLVCGEVENAVVFSLSCGHQICTECLEGFLRSKLRPSDGDLPLQPPYTCKQMGCECEGVLDVASADLPLDEACQEVIASCETALESEATPFRECVCGKFNRPAVGRVSCRCECGAHYCFACGQEAHFPVPCKFAILWLANFIRPTTSEADMESREGELQLLRDLQRIVHQVYMREMERTFILAGPGRYVNLADAVDPLIRYAHNGPNEHQLIAARVLQPEVWEHILPATHRGPQRLPQLTAAELLAVVPPAIRRTLEALGLPEVAAAELHRMLHPFGPQPNDEAAGGVGDGQQEAGEGAVAAGVDAAMAEPAEAPLLLPEPPVPVLPPADSQTHKICPGCYQPVKLEGGGCNSTQCPNCKAKFCYICLRPHCAVVQNHGKCPQGGIDVAAFLAAAQAQNADGAAAASADIAALANYQPDDAEERRLHNAQVHYDPRDDGFPGPRNAREAIDALPPPQSPLECLVHSLALVGFSRGMFFEEAGPNVAAVMRQQQDLEAAGRRGAMFLATSLNVNDLGLLAPLERTRVAWEAISVRLEAFIEGVWEPPSANEGRAVQEAMKLEQWLLVDEWLSLTGRVRGGPDDLMITLRRESLADRMHDLEGVLLAEAPDNVGHTEFLHQTLVSELNTMLQMLHGAFGAGDAMNKRCE